MNEKHSKGLEIAQEQDDIHRLLDILEKDLGNGVNTNEMQRAVFDRVEKLSGKRPSTVVTARRLTDSVL